MTGETFWGRYRGRESALPTTGDDIAPLLEASRANERLLIACSPFGFNIFIICLKVVDGCSSMVHSIWSHNTRHCHSDSLEFLPATPNQPGSYLRLFVWKSHMFYAGQVLGGTGRCW